MKTYVVGGAVRDELLGLPVQDRDYVVVGATPEEMARLGFRPVGADFPVFLHPETHEEYALARTERKTAPGYKGFVFHAAPDVTLEQDLRRRDLTINAMARAADGTLIDPHGGARDLRDRMLRHVSESFAEDPVRVLRVARFAARFGFEVAPETLALLRGMAEAGEVDALVPERAWQEIARGLMEPMPSRLVAVLRECGALPRVLPEVAGADPGSLAARLDRGARREEALPVRFALLTLDARRDEIAALAARLNAPGDCRDLALLACGEREFLGRSHAASPEDLLGLVERSDALRRPGRLGQLLRVAECDTGMDTLPLRERIEGALTAARRVDAGRIAAEHPGEIAAAIRRARLEAIAAATS